MVDQAYILDSDVFITAKNAYYAFDICPGFWKGLLLQHQLGNVFSINRVRAELLAGNKTEDLVQWVSTNVPDGFFHDVDFGEVTSCYTEIMLWAQGHTGFVDMAKTKFATGADGWLVAFAKVHGLLVVSNETSNPDSKRAIKLPDVCLQFNVPYRNTYSMLRELGLQFDLPGLP